MINTIHYKSPVLQRIVAEGDVSFLLARMRRHAPHMYHHSLRVAGLFEMLWADMELSEHTREIALRSALLHDIGCIHIPGEQLNKPHERHTLTGIETLSSMIREGRMDKDMVLYHHENLDGTGFPFGVDWKGLSPFVRTLRIIDDFDVWSGGIYTELSVSVAMDELYIWDDIHFDGKWLERFNRMIIEAIREIPQELDQLSRM